MFCKSNGQTIYSSSPKLLKWYYIIIIVLKENSYKLFRTGFTTSSYISTYKCPPMTHFLVIVVKLQVTCPLNFIFIKKTISVSNIIIKIPKTFRFWFQPLISIEISIFSHSKSSVHRPNFVCVISFYWRVVWQAAWHRLHQFKLESGPIIIIPLPKTVLNKGIFIGYCGRGKNYKKGSISDNGE